MKDLSLHILDIFQNSISAGAKMIRLEMSSGQDGTLTLLFSDNGNGMDEEQVNRVTDPFFTTRTTRKIGMGIPLLAQKAEQSGGEFFIQSAKEKGTEVKAVFELRHPDCPPLGNVPQCAWLLMASNPGIRMIFSFCTDAFERVWDSDQIQEVLGGDSLTLEPVRSGISEWFSSDFSIFKEKNNIL